MYRPFATGMSVRPNNYFKRGQIFRCKMSKTATNDAISMLLG